MDYVLLGLCLFYFLKGYFKGFVSMLFSLIGTFFVFVVAWKLSPFVVDWFQNFWDIHLPLTNFLSDRLNGVFSGEFSSMDEFSAFLNRSKYGVLFIQILKLFVKDISFEGSLSAGEILAPSLSNFILKIVVFVFLFVFLLLVLRMLKFISNKIINVCGLSFGNKWLGAFLGFGKGLIVFGVFYLVFSALANALMNESMISFLKSGNISTFLYFSFGEKIISFFY